MKRKILSIFLVVCMVLSLPVAAAAVGDTPFSDVPSSHWASDAVSYVYTNGLMTGEGYQTFRPNNNLTRAMFVTILGRMAEVTQSDYAGSAFTDVPTGQWYSAYIAWASQTGVVDGTGHGNFSPHQSVTREQMAAMIARYVSGAQLNLPENDHPADIFSDQNRVSSWAQEGVELMRRTGILAGYQDGSFQPQRTASRAEAAAIFMRLDQAIAGGQSGGETVQQPDTDTEEDAGDSLITLQDGQKMVDLVQTIGEMDQRGTTQAEILTYLEGIDWIEAVEQTPNGGVCCRTEFGVTGVWTPQTEDTLGGTATTTAEPVTLQLPNAATAQNLHGPLDLVILCPYASSDLREELGDYIERANDLIEYTGGTVTVLRDEEVSLDALKHLDQYDMVWFFSHGILSSLWQWKEVDPYTTTGEFASSPVAYIILSSDFLYGRTIVDLKDGRISVGGNFYQDYYKENQLDGMFFHFSSCYSMDSPALANGILSRGADWVQGWTGSVSVSDDYARVMALIDQLRMGMPIQESLDAALLFLQTYHPALWHAECVLKGMGDPNYTLAPQSTVPDWQHAYLDYIQTGLFTEQPNMGWTQEMSEKSTYYLFDVNGDDIPELWIDNPFTLACGRLCTYYDGQVTPLILYSSQVSYLPAEKRARISLMRMGTYMDHIYEIKNGTFQQIAYGEYHIEYDSNAVQSSSFQWEDKPVDEEAYQQALNAVYPTDQEISLREEESGLTYSEILAELSL